MNWDEFKAELLDLMGEHAVVDLLIGRGPIALVGFEGVVLNATEGLLDGDPDRPVALCLRVRAEGSSETTRVESYLNILQGDFQNAEWIDTDGTGTSATAASFRPSRRRDSQTRASRSTASAQPRSPSTRRVVSRCWRRRRSWGRRTPASPGSTMPACSTGPTLKLASEPHRHPSGPRRNGTRGGNRQPLLVRSPGF